MIIKSMLMHGTEKGEVRLMFVVKKVSEAGRKVIE
jgi:hypothetical protein